MTTKPTRAVKAWGLKNGKGELFPKSWKHKINAKSASVAGNWLNDFSKVVRVEIREIRKGK